MGSNGHLLRRPLLVFVASFLLFCVLFVTFSSLQSHKDDNHNNNNNHNNNPPSTAEEVCYGLLSKFAPSRPWYSDYPGNSEQRQPFYIGLTPRELEIPSAKPKVLPSIPELPRSLKALGEAQLKDVSTYIVQQNSLNHQSPLLFEMWPVLDDWGQYTWTIARWKKPNETVSSPTCWNWIDGSSFDFDEDKYPYNVSAPFLPRNYYPGTSQSDFGLVFNDFLEFDNLYDKRVFGECVWTKTGANANTVVSAWLPETQVEEYKSRFLAESEKSNGHFNVCRAAPQPSRFNGNAITFVVSLFPSKGSAGPLVYWPTEMRWVIDETNVNNINSVKTQQATKRNKDVEDKYMTDLKVIDGESPARYPISNKIMSFTMKSCAQANNQLGDVVSYLEERYKLLNVQTERQSFLWRGINQANLIAKFPAANRFDPRCEDSSIDYSLPLVVADHIDTAFAEDVFDATGERVSTLGADDNASGVAALLQIAQEMAAFYHNQTDSVWCRDLILLHLTGEEYPSDGLGARRFISKLLQDQMDVFGIIVLDMVGHRLKPSDKIFQVSPGDSIASANIAHSILTSTNNTVTNAALQGVLREWGDPKSYFFNTDGVTFAIAGFPAVLINEHMNLLEGFDRQGYHDTNDTSLLIDSSYAVSITQVTLQSIIDLVFK